MGCRKITPRESFLNTQNKEKKWFRTRKFKAHMRYRGGGSNLLRECMQPLAARHQWGAFDARSARRN